MYSSNHNSPAASGQQSAFSHPPNLVASSSRSPSNASRAQNQYTPQHSFLKSGGSGTWSPAGNSSAAGMDDEDDDDDEDDEVDDEEEEADSSAPPGKKRRRNEDGAQTVKAAKSGKGGKNASATANEEDGAAAEGDEKKPKPTRGAKACKNCRRLKMRCVGAEEGPPCDRCKHTNHACIFEESNRGKRSGKNQKQEAMAASLRKMEATMNNLIQSLRDPSTAFSQGAGMVTRSPSPSHAANGSSNKTDRYFDDRARYTNQTQDRERIERGWPSVSEADELGRAYGALRGGKGRGDVANSPEEAIAQGAYVGQSLRNPGAIAAASPGGNHIDPKALAAQASGSNLGSSSNLRHSTRFVEPERPNRSARQTSPRLHSLPDNTLNPLGLLAEASLHNSQRVRRVSNRIRNGPDDTARTALRMAAGAMSAAGSASSPGGSTSNQSNTAGAAESPATSVKTEADLAQKGVIVDTLPGAKDVKDGAPGTLSAAVAAGTPGGMGDTTERYNLGVASESYFKPGPMTILPLRRIVIERELAPELLTQGIITSEEVLELFRIYFHNCSQHVHLLDPEWHTPTMICGRSPFLFTVVCTIAAKFYTKRPDLHLKCLQMVRKSAYLIMSRGFKSVEIVQGFMLLTLWNTPAERFEEDKTWLFSGVAIRMATDLNLHRKSVASLPGNHPPEDPAVLEREREIINRERTWLVCFSIDRSISGQMGKPWTIREDWIIRNSRHWCLQRLSHPWDLGICGLVELLRLSSRQLDSLYSSTSSISGLNTDIDHSTILQVFNEQLEEWHAMWKARGFFASPNERQDNTSGASITKEEENVAQRLRSANTPTAPAEDEDYHRRTLHFLTKQAPLRYNYAVLILNSFGLQHAVDFPLKSGLDKGIYFTKCLQAAKNIVFAARDGLRPILAYSPDTLFVIISYACVFLLKLTRPTFSAFVDEDSVVAVVTEGADLLESVAMNPTHTPALYASFLRALLQSRMDRTATNRSGATTPHRSRPSSPLEAQQAGAFGSTAQGEEFGEPQKMDEDVAPPSHTSIPANLFSSLGGSLGGNNGTTLTAEQAALLNNYMDGNSTGISMTAGGSNAQTPAIDQLLNESFWGSLLPPGFGGPLDGLATGSVEMFPSASISHTHSANQQYGGTASMAPSNNHTRASTPSFINTFGPNVSFDFSAGSLS